MLLRRIAGGDESAFEALYYRYVRPVFGLAVRRLTDRGRAEHAVREAFISIWHGASTYRTEHGCGARWLWTVAQKAITDQLPATSRVGLADSAKEEWLTFRAHAAVSRLPERERTVLELAYWGGQSESEIAERLQLPVGTVVTHARDGLTRLAHLLERRP